MAVPATERKVIPPHFIAYLDKHRIYELFYDMASALAMHMPDDHILYLRNYLVDVASTRDKARIMIIGPPFIDRKSVAKAVGYLLKLPVISMCDVTNGDPKYYKDSDLLASKFKEFLYSHEMEDMGWILYDFPRNRSEVSALQKLGIRPTHAFQLIPSPQNVAERELWNEKYVGKPVKELSKYMKEYRRRLNGLRPTLKNVLKEVPLHGRSLETISKNLAILGRQSTHSGGPMLPRVVLIGTRGSFKRTIACHMAEQMGVVHINMDELIQQALQQDNELSRELRELSSRNVRLYGKLVVAVLEDRLLDYDCLNKGWVLTGFPRDNKDFAVLDMFDTPPNRFIFPTKFRMNDRRYRVIFITNNSLGALERVTNRRINMYTGEYKHKDEVEEMEDVVTREQFVIHPDDDLLKVLKEQKEFDEQVQGMLDYCKGNCIVVDGTGGLDDVMQRVFKATLQASPPGGLRTDNVEQVLGRKDAEGDKETAQVKPEKSILAMPGRSKSNLRVAFDADDQPDGDKKPAPPLSATSSKIAAGSKTLRTTPSASSMKASPSKLKSVSTVGLDDRTDSAKPICVETSISGIKPIPKPPLVLKKSEDLPHYESCTSIFPGDIQMEWGRVRNKLKSYTSLPPLKTNKNHEK